MIAIEVGSKIDFNASGKLSTSGNSVKHHEVCSSGVVLVDDRFDCGESFFGGCQRGSYVFTRHWCGAE